MNCPNCGAESNTSTCPQCGTQIAKPDAIDEATGKVLASWGLRVGATLIDFLLLVIPEFILRSVLGNAIGTSIYLVLFGIYLVSMWSLGNGRSVGNRVAKTQILDAGTGGQISSQQAFRRYMFLEVYAIVNLYGAVENVSIVALLAVVYGGVDVLFPLFDVRKQSLHDKFARTIVVMADAKSA